jgi:broad specificity phosphatase PhoE
MPDHRAGVYRLPPLRHGEVPSHRGDLPVTERGLATAERAGHRLAEQSDRVNMVSGAPVLASSGSPPACPTAPATRVASSSV